MRTPKSPPRRRILASLARWQVQIILCLICAVVAGWLGPRIYDRAVATRLDFQAEVTLLGFLASILALTASLMVGHVLAISKRLCRKRLTYILDLEIRSSRSMIFCGSMP